METKAEQYYPTYTFNPEYRDIVLLEFEEAQKIANGQTKVYAQLTNILLAIATLVVTILFNQSENSPNSVTKMIITNSIVFVVILFLLGFIMLRYFVDLQRQITINARKVVTLRTMLGLDYGHIHLTLPNWRVEGATNPFAIKYFNGWFYFKSVPFWLLAISINSLWWLATKDKTPLGFELLNYNITFSWNWGYAIITLSYLWVFRRNLNDRHETVYLNFTKLISTLLRVKLVDNFEYIIYRAKLSYLELDRLKVNYEILRKLIVDIEDRSFYENYGFSAKSLVRASLSRFSYLRNKFGFIQHGGTTLTMQLARSLFIPSGQNKYLRKIIEILLSLWLYKTFTKSELLKLHIASVRYERNVYGLAPAIKFFWGELRNKNLTKEEAFFLTERLSNNTSTVKWNRIEHLMTRTGVKLDKTKLKEIYERQVKLRHLTYA
jgi:penicillin-binding protein 1A